jgi:DNA-binding transcriptional MerR regulator
MDGFTADQASRFTGCTAHQLRYWDRIGLVRPAVQSTGGRPGVRRLYSFRDLVALRAVKSLLDSGMSLQRVRRAYDYLRKRAGLEEHLAGVELSAEGDSILARDEETIVDALREGQLAFFVTLDKVAAGVDGKVAQYLYDKEAFVGAVRRVESDLERELHRSPSSAASG